MNKMNGGRRLGPNTDGNEVSLVGGIRGHPYGLTVYNIARRLQQRTPYKETEAHKQYVKWQLNAIAALKEKIAKNKKNANNLKARLGVRPSTNNTAKNKALANLKQKLKANRNLIKNEELGKYYNAVARVWIQQLFNYNYHKALIPGNDRKIVNNAVAEAKQRLAEVMALNAELNRKKKTISENAARMARQIGRAHV